jgi:hypothetical protein
MTKARDFGILTASVEFHKVRLRDVTSSNVEWVAWPKSGEPAMIVEFKGGARYAYLGVSRQQVVAAAEAESVGKYINERIKPNFEVVKLR